MNSLLAKTFAAAFILSASSQAGASNPTNPPSPHHKSGTGVFKGHGAPGKTGAHAPAHILAKPHAPGPTSGAPGEQGAANPLIKKEKVSSVSSAH